MREGSWGVKWRGSADRRSADRRIGGSADRRSAVRRIGGSAILKALMALGWVLVCVVERSGTCARQAPNVKKRRTVAVSARCKECWTQIVGPRSLDPDRWTQIVGPRSLDPDRWTQIVGPRIAKVRLAPGPPTAWLRAPAGPRIGLDSATAGPRSGSTCRPVALRMAQIVWQVRGWTMCPCGGESGSPRLGLRESLGQGESGSGRVWVRESLARRGSGSGRVWLAEARAQGESGAGRPGLLDPALGSW